MPQSRMTLTNPLLYTYIIAWAGLVVLANFVASFPYLPLFQYSRQVAKRPRLDTRKGTSRWASFVAASCVHRLCVRCVRTATSPGRLTRADVGWTHDTVLRTMGA